MRSVITLGAALALLLAACGQAGPSPSAEPSPTAPSPSPTFTATSAPSVTPAVAEDVSPPLPETPSASTEPQAYPPPEPLGPLNEEVYPAPDTQGALKVSWEEAKRLILDGQAAQVTQLHSLSVLLVLKDGRVLETVEPEIDDVFAVIEQCGTRCDDIRIATE